MTIPLTISEAARDLRDRSLSAVELVDEALRHADRLDGLLNVYVTRFDDTARDAASAADNHFAAGIDRGPLQGMPIGIKDIILTQEAPTSGGSDVENSVWKQRRDAQVVAQLRAAGAVIIGKTTTSELAIGVPETGYLHRESRNPWDAGRWAGGSSAGSTVGVSASMFLAGVGSDTGGSIRLPAAYCGLTGLKPTFGRVSRTDVIQLGASLDVVGPIAHSAADVATMLQVMAGSDPRDPSTVDHQIPNFSDGLGRSLEGLKVGVERKHHLNRELAIPETVDRFEDAVADLERTGALVREIELPYYDEGVNAVLITIFAEGFAYHSRELREQWQAFAPATRRSLSNGTLFSAADYVMAQKVRRVLRRYVTRLYDDVDLIVCPTAVTAAPELEAMSLEKLTAGICTDYWSAIGNPVVSIPIGFSNDGMPLGMQIAGRHFDEVTVLQAADAYQRVADWHLRSPPTVSALPQNEHD